MVAISTGIEYTGPLHSIEDPAAAQCSQHPGGGAGFYCYAGAAQTFTGTGAVGFFGIHQPIVAPGDYHSLAELEVSCCQSNPTILQVIEVGWIVLPAMFGDSGPHLFVNAWVNGVSLGYNKAFHISPSAKFQPGDLLASSSAPMEFAIKFAQGNWWVMFDGSWLGYFPSSLWANQFTSVDTEQWFGEVAASRALPSTAMGNGIAGSQTGSAQVSNMEVLNPAGAAQIAAATLGTVTNPSLYSVGGQAGNTFSSFRYGGQGDPPSKVILSGGPLYATSGIPGSSPTLLSSTILSSLPAQNFGKQALFWALDTSGTFGVWISNGTVAGTTELAPGLSPALEPFTVLSTVHKAIFFCLDASTFTQLCVTDGTPAGTQSITFLAGGFQPNSPIVSLGSRAVFSGATSSGTDLWVSDGTPQGTQALTTSGTNPQEIVFSSGKAFFSAGSGDSALWVSDGTAAGTHVVDPSIPASLITPISTGVAFAGSANNTTQLYQSDGTVLGTVALGGMNPQLISGFGNKILFEDLSAGPPELFMSNGVPGGITQLTNGNTPNFIGLAQFLGVLGNQMLFSAGGQNLTDSLWATDGTAAGTVQLKSVAGPNGLNPGSLVLSGDHAFFLGDDSSGTRQLWVTNGSSTGQLTTASDGIFGPVAFGEKVLFLLNFGGGYQLWSSNGTVKGTQEVSLTGDAAITVLPH
jgi:ELWxxDGT repeat protein